VQKSKLFIIGLLISVISLINIGLNLFWMRLTTPEQLPSLSLVGITLSLPEAFAAGFTMMLVFGIIFTWVGHQRSR
jgi:uncharacterized membrane protein YGL010W